MRHLLLILLLVLVVACNQVQPEVIVAHSTETPLPVPTETPLPAPTETLPPPVISTEEPAADADAGVSAPVTEDIVTVDAYETDFGWGVQSHATVGDPAYTMEVVANQLGMEWIKVQMRWAIVERQPGEYDWGIWDAVINEANGRGLRVMLSIVTSPEWSRAVGDQHGPPDDYNQYYNFLAQVLSRYPQQVHAVEIWNEQNIDREWQTAQGVDPINYVEFLRGAYETVQPIDDKVIVISGALAPTGVHDPNKMTVMNDMIWTDEALALGLLDYADCVGVHHNGYNLPPDVGFDEVAQAGTADEVVFKGPWANPHESWSFETTLTLMAQKVQAVDPDKKLCVTEFGWASSEGYDEIPATFEFALDNSLQEQAQYIVQAYQLMRDSDDVLLAFLFNFDYGNKGRGPTDDTVPYSIVDVNGVPRPAFSAVAEMDK